MPPPTPLVASFPLITLATIVSALCTFWMPPPRRNSLPLVIVSPLRVTVWFAWMSRMRNVPLTRCTVS